MARKRHYIRDAIGRFARVAGRKAIRYVRKKARQSLKRDLAGARAIGRVVGDILIGPTPYYADLAYRRRAANRGPARKRSDARRAAAKRPAARKATLPRKQQQAVNNGLLRSMLTMPTEDVHAAMRHWKASRR